MLDLESLFTKFKCSSIESLLDSICNQIDWYNEMLLDDPWNTWTQTKLDSLKELELKVKYLFAQNGADNDIDLHR